MTQGYHGPHVVLTPPELHVIRKLVMDATADEAHPIVVKIDAALKRTVFLEPHA